ncbi:hypothetical protein BH09BAC4_BH09BAC4_31200 [soil metagenome]
MKFKNNKDVVEYFGQGFVTGNDLAVYEEIVAKDFVDHATPNGGYQSMLDTFQAMRAAMPDMTLVIHRLIDDDDCVACLKSLVGHHTGAAIFGVAATGNPMQIDLIDILRIQNGQFVENWVYNNTAEVMSALQQKRPIANLLSAKPAAK